MREIRLLKFYSYMVSIFWSLVRDLIWENLSLEEIKTNYLFGKANAYDLADFPNKSIKVYQRLLKADSNNVPVFLNLGGLYYRRGMPESAVLYYKKVIRINPKHYQGHYWLAMSYWKLRRYYAAINTLEEIIEFLPTFKDALNLMGECYERIGEGAKAEHYYLRAISADPEGIIIHGGVLKKGTREGTGVRVKH